MANTAEQLPSQTREQVVKEAKRIEESLLYSSKGHFVAASFWTNFHLTVGLPLVVLSAIAGTGVLKGLPHGVTWQAIAAVLIAVFSAMITFLNPSERHATHLKAGNDYDSLMNRTRIFWAIDCLSEKLNTVITKDLDDISKEKDKLNKAYTQIPFWAFVSAKKGILKGESEYSVDKPSTTK